MDNKIKTIGVLTSGGDSPGMNAAIRAVVRTCAYHGLQCQGIFRGFQGLMEGDFEELGARSVNNIINKGGTMLKSARSVEFTTIEGRKKAFEKLQEAQIDALVVIGGDGTYRGAMALHEMGINCIGIPATIDNDIVSTDYSIGFDTALNTIIQNVDKLRDTSASHHRCSIIEVMGNRCGDLAIYAGITTGAEVIVSKETGYDESDVLERLRHLEEIKRKRHAIMIISEKITDVDLLAKKVSQFTGFSGRATVLGHIQRGGSPTARDRFIATQFGDKAVDLLVNEISGQCVCLKEEKVISLDIEVALNLPKASRKDLFALHKRLV